MSPDQIDRILDYVRVRMTESKDPRWGQGFVPSVAARLDKSVTKHGIGHDAALDLFANSILPSCRPNDSPRMLSYVPTAPSGAARAMDVILGAVSIFGSHWEAGSGAIAAENEALRWLANLAGFPREAGGCFVSGGSAANLSALVAARYAWRAKRGRSLRENLRIAATREAHASIASCAHVMDADLVELDAPGGVMDIEYLGKVLEADSKRPSIFAVVATGGTTSEGRVDDLCRIAELCAKRGIWLHVDAAYGGAALCAPSARSLFEGIERADSITIDPHKWLFAPYDCAAVIYRAPQVAAAAHAQRANYLDQIDPDAWNPADYAFHLSRRARGLPLWFGLATHGTKAYSDAVELTLNRARWLANRISESDNLVLLRPPDLSIVLFERRGWDRQQYDEWSRHLSSRGIGLVNPLSINDKVYARVCLVNPLTTESILEEILASLA